MKLRRSLAVLGLLMLALQAEGLPRTPILVAGCGFAFPSVSPGSPIVGQVEIAHGGARAGNSYQWKYGDNGSAIGDVAGDGGRERGRRRLHEFTQLRPSL
jgi:hypothetical protein